MFHVLILWAVFFLSYCQSKLTNFRKIFHNSGKGPRKDKGWLNVKAKVKETFLLMRICAGDLNTLIS